MYFELFKSLKKQVIGAKWFELANHRSCVFEENTFVYFSGLISGTGTRRTFPSPLMHSVTTLAAIELDLHGYLGARVCIMTSAL